MVLYSSQQLLVSVKKLSKIFEQQVVLQSISFSIHKGEKIGLVGVNGSGKTTLLKMILGQLSYDEGVIDIAKDVHLEYLAQLHDNQNLSGGETAKRILIPLTESNADLFLLDEPTNNLDIQGLEMLEHFITKSDAAFLIVSHDRTFLDKIVTKIIELDEHTRKSTIYDGTYSEYREQRTARIERQWKEYADKQQKAKNYTTSIQEKGAWQNVLEQKRKNIRNLPIHEREKPVASILRDKEGKMGRRARLIRDKLEKHIDETETIEKPVQQLSLKIQFEEEVRGGTKVFELEGPLSLSVQYGDRILIQGNNGAGKTTLLKMLMGELAVKDGTLVKGKDVRVGYIAQDKAQRSSNKKVLEAFIDITGLEVEESRKILSRFRIAGDDVKKDISDISPGEYSRLMIATLIAVKPNCIILDEPTNHLDLEVLEELEKALQVFKGTLIVVSHDRYFIEKITITKTYTMVDGKIVLL